MECPRCGLVNPTETSRCDCGYDFVTARLDQSRLGGTPEDTHGELNGRASATEKTGGQSASSKGYPIALAGTMKTLRVQTDSGAGGALVMTGLFGLACGLLWTFDSRIITWQMGLVIVVPSLATLCLVFKHPRFDCWVEFGDHLKHHDFSGVQVNHWRDVKEISYSTNSDASSIDITLTSGKTITIGGGDALVPSTDTNS